MTLELFFRLLGAGGLALLLHGIWGRRVGDEPRCRKCKYNLTGIEAARCPECGRPLVESAVGKGLRRRNRVTLVGGLMLISFSLLVYGQGLNRRTNWYRYYPTIVVTKKARNEDRDAILELVRRIAERRVADQGIVRLADLAVNKYTAEERSPNKLVWMKLALLVNRQHGLTTQQGQLLFGPMIDLEATSRPKLGQGGNLGLEVRCQANIDLPAEFVLALKPGVARVGGLSLPPPGAFWTIHDPLLSRGWGSVVSRFCLWWPASELEVGVHTVEYSYHRALFRRGADPRYEKPVWRDEQSFSGQVEILGDPVPEILYMPDDQALAGTIQRVLTCRAAEYEDPVSNDAPRLGLTFTMSEPLPVNISFDILVEVGGVEILLGQAICPKGVQRTLHASTIKHNIPDTQLTPILRTVCGLRSARSFPWSNGRQREESCFDIWKGELRYEAMPITTVVRLGDSGNE